MATIDGVQRELHETQLRIERIEVQMKVLLKEIEDVKSISIKNQITIQRALGGLAVVGGTIIALAAMWNFAIEWLHNAVTNGKSQ